MTPKLAWAARIGRNHAPARQDLPQGGGRPRLGRWGPHGEHFRDVLRVGPHEHDERQAHEHEARACEPEKSQGVPVQLATREQRAEHRGPQDRAEHGTGEDEGDPSRPPLGGIHISRGRARQERRTSRRAHEHQAEEDGKGGVDGASERGQHAAECADDEARRENGHAAEAIHRTPRRKRGECSRGEDDRRAETQQALDSGDEHERERGDSGRELEHPGVGRQRSGEERGVPLDREVLGRAGHAG